MDQSIRRKDEIRLRLLRAIYQMTDGRENYSVSIDDEIAGLVGTSVDEAQSAARFLDGEGMLKRLSGGSNFEITHAGTVEFEESLRDPEHGTRHFQPAVIVSANSDLGANNVLGSVQKSGTGNAASENQTVKSTATKTAIQELRKKVASLPPEKHEEAHSVLDQIEDMLEKGPKTWAAARMLIMSLVTYWPDAVPWLTNIARQLFGG